MPSTQSRFTPAASARAGEGLRLERITPPSRLFGANGLRRGPDGRLYVAQVSGSQISAIDVNSGAIEAIVPKGGDIVGPDDLAFDDQGNLYATEFTEGRVSMRAPNGRTRVVNGELPCANPITFHQGRLFAGECRPAGRILELDLNGGAPRVILDNVPMPNAMSVGPDGKLYVPIMGVNEIWRLDLATGAKETVATGLGVPDSVKFDRSGMIVSTQVASGQVLRIDPNTGDKTVLATIAPGLDNLDFIGDRLFVSSISGQVNEITASGRVRNLVPDGLNWPLGLAVLADGRLFVADGGFNYTLEPRGKLEPIGMLFSPGFPGYIRGVAAAGAGVVVVTTANGQVSRWWPAEMRHEVIADGFDRLMGVAVAPGGDVVFAEAGGGRVLRAAGGKVETLASGLKEPTGVALGDDGTAYFCEADAGRVARASGGKATTVLDGLRQPQGLAWRDGKLLVLDVLAQELIECAPSGGDRRVLASHLPVGTPPGVVQKPLKSVMPLCGPMGPFAGLATGPDGTVYVSADAEGSVLALRNS